MNIPLENIKNIIEKQSGMFAVYQTMSKQKHEEYISQNKNIDIGHGYTAYIASHHSYSVSDISYSEVLFKIKGS
jgi:hypothetical protein